ncbi:pyruvate:ferredoxin (flavodoxin) oxidoreductase [uncultured Eubacterium sp.]|uniref:pyruvate:ferredoxin (flavodoxin) oxidoreductase n=1 Tax=uncultured Eubacterium sp. TaxID=165185 RepID=UPI00260B8C26|nr:pyruvate:ferredoxin (flavodoxin) oxidoreductase [uncultured Eubacterium sp.]
MARKKKTMDGNSAAAHVSYAFTEVAAIYPITPSSPMAEETDAMAAKGVKNLFGQTVKVAELESEAGAAGAVHGSLSAGALTTTYTASQGLLLMIPNMYKIAGELIPSVIHVSARCVSTHALNIFGDHSDVMACRQTGYAMLCSANVQEVMDLGAVAHLATLKSRVPFLHFFDGFRTSHEVQKIETWDYEDLRDMLDMQDVADFRARALNPEHPVLRGSAENSDIFFQHREACNKYYADAVSATEAYMNKVNEKIGTNYQLFNYYGAEDADRVIIAMGSVCDTIKETVDFLNARGEKVGMVSVHLYRPFSAKHLVKVIPKTVKHISVIDRTKEPGALGEPLYLDVVAALKGTELDSVPVYGGRYGLGSKDTLPAHVIAVFANMNATEPKKTFVLSINDDVTDLSLPITETPDTTPKGTTSCKFWGLGSDGTVGANKDSIKIIGDHTDMYAQGYFFYDSKKSGGITVSHLRFGSSPITSTYLINKANFVACHNPSYVTKYDMVQDLVPGGTFLLNCIWSPEELDSQLPASMKRYIAENDIKLYTINGIKIAEEVGLPGRASTILQSAFFTISGILPVEDAIKYMKEKVVAKFSKKGDAVVNANCNGIDRGSKEVIKIDVPASWKDAVDEKAELNINTNRPEMKKFVKNILDPVGRLHGDDLPVSAFVDSADGVYPQGSAAFEKRGIAISVPEWDATKCAQCNLCSMVCPHAVIRPIVMNAEEAAAAPEGTTMIKHKRTDYQYALIVSVLDCTGCGSCANVCPTKSLTMKPIASQLDVQKSFDALVNTPAKPEVLTPNTIGVQFRKPYLEFSGACAGCGETPYAKLATQLYGDKMYIANATGCSSIWGGSAPSTPYTVDENGHGPAWSNSLFEDNAEFGYGMYLAQKQIRERLAADAEVLSKAGIKEADAWLATFNDAAVNDVDANALIKAIENASLDGEAASAAEAERLAAEAAAAKRQEQVDAAQAAHDTVAYGDKLGRIWVEGTKVDCALYWGDSESQFSRGAGCRAESDCVLPGENGTVLIGAHTGTYFSDLGSVRLGAMIHLETDWGDFTYQVTDMQVILETDIDKVRLGATEPSVVLYTCYPFGILTHTTQRYAVYADPVSADASGVIPADTTE